MQKVKVIEHFRGSGELIMCEIFFMYLINFFVAGRLWFSFHHFFTLFTRFQHVLFPLKHFFTLIFLSFISIILVLYFLCLFFATSFLLSERRSQTLFPNLSRHIINFFPSIHISSHFPSHPLSKRWYTNLIFLPSLPSRHNSSPRLACLSSFISILYPFLSIHLSTSL